MAEEQGGGSFPLPDLGIDTRGRFVVIDPETYNQYYNVVANPMLWFIQHYLWDLSNAPDVRREELDAWDNGYLAANRAVRRGGQPGARRGSGAHRDAPRLPPLHRARGDPRGPP